MAISLHNIYSQAHGRLAVCLLALSGGLTAGKLLYFFSPAGVKHGLQSLASLPQFLDGGFHVAHGSDQFIARRKVTV